VQSGDRVYAGQRLTDGPIIPQRRILECRARTTSAATCLDEVQLV
jgi:hypothetical protein